MNILVIGAGYWGQKLIERFGNILGVNHVGIYDRDETRLSEYRTWEYFCVQAVGPPSAWLKGSFVDAVAIATPISSHYELAREWLEAGKHVFVEKPLAQTAEQARELGQLAEKKGLVLMTDLTFLHDLRIERLAKGTLRGMLWSGPESRTSDEDIFWTWAPHPLSIALMINGEPSHIGAVKMRNIGGNEAVFIPLHYDGKPGYCHILLQWGLGIFKERLLFTESRPGVSEHLDLTKKPSVDPLLRTCGSFVEAVESLGLRPQDLGVRVAEMMAWTHEEFLTSINSPSLEVKKWEADQNFQKSPLI
jgi:predicted dehydrogenase